ncbi:MAG: hypothetical protein NXI20_24620 [bacterium]|nr:hypothetical protein [bacterium]
MFKTTTNIICAMLLLLSTITFAQESGELPYDEIFAYGMDANVKPILPLLDQSDLNDEDREFKEAFEKRFAGSEDNGESPDIDDPEIKELVSIFREYWRKSLLDKDGTYERELGMKVVPFLMKNYPEMRGKQVTRDSLGYYISSFIKSRGYYSTPKVDFVGSLISLMIWKTQESKVYNVELGKGEKQEVTTFFMSDFVSLGWMEYATLGHHHAGGWTEDDGIYCVAKSYDTDSENFKVSYLAHEARHFADKKIWPNLDQADLEYRAKLTEISQAQTTCMDLIEFFMQNANKDSKNGHQIANYYLIRDLSREIFDSEFQDSLTAWKLVSLKKLNKAAAKLLKANTASLKELGESTENFITLSE